jgi:hypothetical protein
VIQEEEEEPNEAERKQIEDDEGAGKRSQMDGTEAERKQIEDDEGTGKLNQTDGTEAAIEEEEPNEAERKQIEDDEGAAKRSQAEEGGRNASDDNWLNCIVIAIAVLLVIAGLASPLLGPWRSRPARFFRLRSLRSRSARSFRLGSLRSSSARSFRLRLFWSTS